MVVDILIGLQERSLEYSIVRDASAISPVNMVSKKEEWVLRFQGLNDVLFRKKRLSAKSADNCKQQYDKFLEDVQLKRKENILKFNYLTDRVDDFLCPYLPDEKKLKKTYGMYVKYWWFSSMDKILLNVVFQSIKKSQITIYRRSRWYHNVWFMIILHRKILCFVNMLYLKH